MDQDKDSRHSKKQWGLVFVVAYEIIGAVLAGIFIGRWIDESYDLKPWGSMIAIILFFVVVLANMIRRLTRMKD